MMSDNETCRWTRFRNILCLIVAIALFSMPTTVVGQIITGSVVGIVADSSGAAIPDAKLVLTDISTGVQRSAASDATGNYAFPDVKPGRYIVKVTVDGFKQLASSEIVSPVSSTPRPSAPCGQCKAVEPSKCPPHRISVRPSSGETVSPSQKQIAGSGRITHCRLSACQ